jgi:hypothetical protein
MDEPLAVHHNVCDSMFSISGGSDGLIAFCADFLFVASGILIKHADRKINDSIRGSQLQATRVVHSDVRRFQTEMGWQHQGIVTIQVDDRSLFLAIYTRVRTLLEISITRLPSTNSTVLRQPTPASTAQ